MKQMGNEVFTVDGTPVKTTYAPSEQDRHYSDRARCWYEQGAERRWPARFIDFAGNALTTQVARAADIGAATLIESKQPIDFLRQSDASTPRETHRVPLIIDAQPERSRGT